MVGDYSGLLSICRLEANCKRQSYISIRRMKPIEEFSTHSAGGVMECIHRRKRCLYLTYFPKPINRLTPTPV